LAGRGRAGSAGMSTVRTPPAAAVLATLFLAPAANPDARAEDDTPEPAVHVEKVEIRGNQYVQTETLLYYVSTKAGERYDEARLKADFRRLWDTGFLDDLTLEVVDGAGGKVAIFGVSERKRIQIVDYRGSKELTKSAIEDELKKRDAQVRIDTFYDLARARKVEAILRDMLNARGRPFAAVRHEAKPIGGAAEQLSFVIEDGPKAKVKQIVFDGNAAFPDGTLAGRMKKIKAAGFWNLSWLGGKTKYSESKWRGEPPDPGDQKRLEDFYLNHGYVTAQIGAPRVTYTDGRSGLFRKKPVKWVTLTIPVTEGAQYRVGEVKFEGLTVLKESFVRPLFKTRTGDVYDESKFKKGFDKLRDAYGSIGYFQWSGGTKRAPDPARGVVDVTLAMDEDKRYYVGQIRITGNDSTRDKVLRREIYLNEGDVLNTDALKATIRRINQLGYFKPMEGAPDLQPSPRADDRIDITLNVEEQNRNQFSFGGGMSGLEGAFLNASFSTTNFLGAGETVSLAAQAGARTKSYQLAITEPYFLDRPITLGFDVYLRRLTNLSYYDTVVGYSQQEQGLGVTTGIPVSRFSRAFASYGYQIVDIYDVDQEALDRLRTTPSGTASIPGVDPTLLQNNVGRRYESRITPSWVRNTVDNPFLPRKGARYTASFQYTGGPLGGSVNYFRPTLEAVFYRPVGGKMALGLRGQVAYTRPFGETTEVPYYQRFFLGGETQIRGYKERTVSPLDPETNTAIGGNKYMLFNAEYYFDLLGPVRFLLFFDAGQAYPEGQGFYWKTMSTSTGAELRFLMPVLNVPFRLIYAWNANRDYFQPKTVFKFAVGTTF
jgi:outer membrane protein insertion porin family